MRERLRHRENALVNLLAGLLLLSAAGLAAWKGDPGTAALAGIAAGLQFAIFWRDR